MRVLLSIRPQFALQIFEGSKRYEYRRAIFKREGVTSVLVYASAPIGKVIGEFQVAEILYDKPTRLWTKTKTHAGISQRNFFQYFLGAYKGYAIKVKRSAIYEVPLSLSSFSVSWPPQSFMYVE
jgi:predicted transcriptional regulator